MTTSSSPALNTLFIAHQHFYFSYNWPHSRKAMKQLFLSVSFSSQPLKLFQTFTTQASLLNSAFLNFFSIKKKKRFMFKLELFEHNLSSRHPLCQWLSQPHLCPGWVSSAIPGPAPSWSLQGPALPRLCPLSLPRWLHPSFLLPALNTPPHCCVRTHCRRGGTVSSPFIQIT